MGWIGPAWPGLGKGGEGKKSSELKKHKKGPVPGLAW